jgi:Peptidase_C39 like family
MATIYASINFPKAVPYGPDQCWYTEGEANNYYTNNANLNPAGYRNSQGKLCVTKNTVITRMYDLAKAKGYSTNKTFTTSGGDNNAADLNGADVEEYLKAMQEFVPVVATKAQIEAALAELNDRQDTIISNAVNSSFALPSSFFQGCTFSDSNTGLITTGANPTSLVACIKSILNYVFVIAVLYVIVSLAASNLGIAITSGANGRQPVANARKQLEKSLIGLFLIGAPYLLLDLFASSTGLFNLVALDKLPNFQSFTLTIDSGLPAPTPGEKTPLILGYLFGNNNQTNTEFGASIDGLQAGGSARGGDERSVNPDLCAKSPTSCKVLDVPYVSQVFNADGKATPNGNSACAAASTVMAVAYIKPEIYNNSTGKNNAGNTATGVPGNLSLRENIFYANSYLASKSYTTNCEYVMTDSGKESTKVNGVFSITGVPTKRKIVSTGEIVRVCDGSDRTHIVNQYFPLVGLKGKIAAFNSSQGQYYDLIRQEIDANRPVILRFEDSNLAPFGHYVVIKGYVTGTTSFVINDPWGRFTGTQFSPSTNAGNGAIYNLNSLNGKAIITMSK